MGTDFFDDDLVKQSRPARAARDEGSDVPVRQIADLNVSRLVAHKREVSTQMAGAVQEIEQLRQKQDHLEQEKRHLEELARKQKAYEDGKREVIETLDRSLVLLEKEELQATRSVELLADMRGRFKETLAEVQAIDENTWPEEHLEEQLNKAIVLIDSARLLHRRASAKIEALEWQKGGGTGVPSLGAEGLGPLRREETFGHWLKIGAAVTLPLVAVLLLLFAIYVILFGLV